MFRDKIFSKSFAKTISKLKGEELKSVLIKIKQICNCEDINHYKNLKYGLKNLKEFM